MRKIFILITLFFFLSLPSLHAQFGGTIGPGMMRFDIRKIDLTEGDPKVLLTFHKINITYNYDGMTVGEFQSEGKFLQYMIDKKGEEKGKEFVKNWQNWPKQLFEPRFEEMFIKKMRKYPITASNYSTDGDVNLLVKVISEDPDYHYAKSRNIVVTCTFSDRQNNLLLKFDLIVDGSHEFTMQEGLAECYGFAGGMLSKEMRRLINLQRAN